VDQEGPASSSAEEEPNRRELTEVLALWGSKSPIVSLGSGGRH
jgi:hypothetical protein